MAGQREGKEAGSGPQAGRAAAGSLAATLSRRALILLPPSYPNKSSHLLLLLATL